jgi:integrase/recombinase XerD
MSSNSVTPSSPLARRLIFSHDNDRPFTNVRWDFQRYRPRAARKAAFAPFRFHDLRHLFALRGGMGVYALSHHLGHGSVSVTEIYLRFLDGDAAQIARAA